MRSSARRALAALTLAAVVGTAAMSAGCGESAELDPTPVKTWKITPAATVPGGATEVPTEPAAESPTAPADGTPVSGTVLDIAAVSSVFDKTELEAPAGSITIRLDNQDGGIVHNITVFNGEDSSADILGSTDLEAGPIEQELTLELQPGSYFYQCDAHPTTMKGVLTVS